MKLSYSALFGLLALAAGSVSHGQIVIRFSASNGDRNATQVAISRTLTNWTYQGLAGATSGTGGPGQAPNDTFRTSNFGTWNGTWNGRNVIIKTNYAGALAGLQAVANQDIAIRFDPTDGTGDTAIPANPLTATNPDHYEEGTVDFGLSTNFQSTSPFLGEYDGTTYNELKEIPVGISQLGFYGSPGLPIDNITTQQARLLYDSGAIPLSLITGNWVGDDGDGGNTGDSKKYIYAIGRNTDAGQRFSAQQEIGRSGIGFQFAWEPWNSPENPAPLPGGVENAPLIPDPENEGQWIPNLAHDPAKSFRIGSSQPIGGLITGHRQWNGGVDQVNSGILASGGYNSGANLAIGLTYKLASSAYKTVDPEAKAGWYIGYITPGDANVTLLGIGQGAARPDDTKGVALKYNGIENTPENVKSGKYTLWLYNRIITPLDGVGDKSDPGETPGFRGAFVEALTARIKIDVGSQQGIRLDDPDLKVFRSADGGTVFPGSLPTGD